MLALEIDILVVPNAIAWVLCLKKTTSNQGAYLMAAE